jgi:subtilisin family serine protease
MRRVITAFTLAVFFAAPGWAAMNISDELQGVLANASDDELVPVYVVMHEQAGYEYFRPMIQGISKSDRRVFVIEELKRMASRSQEPLLSYLKIAELSGDVRDVRSLWLVNLISFEARPSVIDNVADMFEARYMWYNNVVPAEEAMDAGVSGSSYGGGFIDLPNPGVEFVNAPAAWAVGWYGAGAVVCNVDSGTEWYHPDIENHIWVNTAEDYNGNGYFEPYSSGSGGDEDGIDNDGNGYVDDVIGWNFSNDTNDPDDSGSHGTATSGIVVGDGTNNSGDTTGVAPDAKLMILNINSATQAEWYEAYQYAAENGADVTTSSFSQKWGVHDPDYSAFRFANENELALGVVHTNSIGNQGDQIGSFPIPYNIAAPGNSPPPWLHPDQSPLIGGVASVLGCGAMQESNVIEDYSGNGPSAWEDILANHPSYPHNTDPLHRDYPYETAPAIGLLKPDVCGPGSFTYSTAPGGGYQIFGGTSSSTPHVGGVCALMVCANPELTPEQLAEAIMTTAIDFGAPGKDTLYGAGKVDAFAACTMAVYMTWSLGWIEGIVDDGTNPIQDATVTMRSGNSCTTNPTGYFVCYGDTVNQYVVCEAFGFISDSTLATPVVNDTITQNFTLVAASVGTVEGTVTESAGGDPIPNATLTLLGTPVTPVLTNSAGFYQITNVPEGSYDLEVSHPFFVDDTINIVVTSGGTTVQDFALDRQSTFTGPDAYGYYAFDHSDSQYTEVPVYDWFDISGIGTPGPTGDDQRMQVTLPFTFTYYGTNYTTGWICTNGWFSLGSDPGTNDLNNSGIPDPDGPPAMIAALWDDLNPNESGDIKYYNDASNNRFIVQWTDVAHYATGTTAPETFQIVLYDPAYYPTLTGDGEIVCFYYDDWDQDDITVGIENETETIGIQFYYDGIYASYAASLGASTCVKFTTDTAEYVVSVPDHDVSVPTRFTLHAAFPNPFNPTTTIAFDLPSTSTVRLDVYNVLGQRVATLVDGELPAGVHEIRWDASSVGSGVYFARIVAGENTATTKMVLLK